MLLLCNTQGEFKPTANVTCDSMLFKVAAKVFAVCATGSEHECLLSEKSI